MDKEIRPIQEPTQETTHTNTLPTNQTPLIKQINEENITDKPLRKLNKRQIEFCRHYSLCHNGAESARKAGYICKNPEKQAYALLKKESIKQYIAKEEYKREEKYRVTVDSLIEEICELKETATMEGTKARCIELKAKITGHMSDNQVNINTNVVTAEEIKAFRSIRKDTPPNTSPISTKEEA